MVQVAYITPNFTANAVRFIEAFLAFHNIRLHVISQEPIHLLPSWQQSRIQSARQIPDVLQAELLIDALSTLESTKGKIDKLVSASEPLQEPLAVAREALGIQGMDIRTARQFRDKSEMKLLFEKNGIPCAKHTVVRYAEDAKDFTSRSLYPYVIKPLAGAGSQTTFKVRNNEELEAMLPQAFMNGATELIMEEFVEGNEFSIDTFSLNGKILSQTINQYYPTPLEVMANPWIQWRVILRKEIREASFDDIRAINKDALDILGMKTGLTHMEWFRRKDGSIAVSEVAARPPGAQFTTLISRACDFDAVKAWVQLMVFEEAVIPEMKYTSGAAYLRTQGPGPVSHVTGLEEIRSKHNDIITDIRFPYKRQPKSQSYEGEGFIIVRHTSSERVDEALKDIVSTVKVHSEN